MNVKISFTVYQNDGGHFKSHEESAYTTDRNK